MSLVQFDNSVGSKKTASPCPSLAVRPPIRHEAPSEMLSLIYITHYVPVVQRYWRFKGHREDQGRCFLMMGCRF